MKRAPGLASVSQALAAFLATFAVIIGIGIFIARADLPVELAILATPGATLLVAMGAIRVFRLDPYRAFLLRPAKNSHLLLSVPVALSLFVVSDQLANLSRAFIPIDEDLLRTVAELVRAEGLFSWLIRLAGIGFGAALSEELLFRGVILTGLRSLGRGGAVLVSALLFTVMHGLLLPNYFVAGVILGLAATATGSILIPISIHLFHNVASLLLFNLADLETLGDPLWTPPGILIPALGILGIGVSVYLRGLGGRTRAAATETPAPEPHLPAPPPGALGLGRDLAEVRPGRRRLGFAVLGLAMTVGVLIAAALFGYLGYLTNPGPQRAAAIRSLRQISREALTPAAAARGAEVDAAFETLSELNREGRVRFRHIWRAARVVAAATADGEFGDGDVERLLMTVGAIRQEPATERQSPDRRRPKP